MDIKKYLCYPVELKAENDGSYTAAVKNDGTADEYTFERWHTCGSDLQEVEKMAADVVLTIADSLIKDRLHVPAAAEFAPGDHQVKIPYHCALKIAIRELMLQQGCRPGELAQRLNIKKQNVNSLLDLRKETSLEALAKVFAALGYELNFSAVPL